MLLSDLAPRRVVCSDHALHSVGGPAHVLGSVTYDQHMLLVVIVGLRGRSFFLRPLASDEYLAARLLLEPLLIETFRANKHAYVVDASVLRQVNLLLNL